MLEEKLNSKRCEVSDLEQKVQLLSLLTSAMVASPVIQGEDQKSAFELIAAIGFSTDKPEMLDELMPLVVADAVMDGSNGDMAGDFIHQPITGQILLQHTFFMMKSVKDQLNKAKSQLETLRRKHAKLCDKHQQQRVRKRKAAFEAVESVQMQQQEDVAETRLARRNQLNRIKRGIKKIKKQRSEEDLPEALVGPLSCGFCSISRRFLGLGLFVNINRTCQLQLGVGLGLTR